MVGEKIRLAREKKGLTQEQLGEYIGLGQSAINKLENGKLRANPKRVAKIAEVLELDPVDLLSEEEGYFVTVIYNQDNKAGSQNGQFINVAQELTKELIRAKDEQIESVKKLTSEVQTAKDESIRLLQDTLTKYEAILNHFIELKR